MGFTEKKVGEPFAERLGQLWEARGVESDKRGFWSGWVMKLGQFLAPKKFYQATLADVDAFYAHLVGEGRSDRQVEQASRILDLFSGKWSLLHQAAHACRSYDGGEMTERFPAGNAIVPFFSCPRLE